MSHAISSTHIDLSKYSRVALLDTCFVGKLYTTQKRVTASLDVILKDYDLILIPNWVWIEIKESDMRKEWFEKNIESKYPILIIDEIDYSPFVKFKENDLVELFYHASSKQASIRSWMNKNVRKGDKLDWPSYDEWVTRLYHEWPLNSGICESGRDKKKNAGDISLIVLAEVISRYYPNIESVTIYSDDNNCYDFMKSTNEELKDHCKTVETPCKITFKSQDVILAQLLKTNLIQQENVDSLRLEQDRKLRYCQTLSDYSVKECWEVVTNQKFIQLALDDSVTFIF